MVSARKAAFFSAYYIFAWTAITMDAKDVALIHLSYEGDGYNINDYTFQAPMFEKFHSCLCSGNAAECRAHYQYTNPGSFSVDIIYDNGSVGNNSISRTYKCTNVASLSSLSCEQQSLQALPDFSTGKINSQSFIIPQSACGSKCVVLLWKFNVEEIIFNDVVGAENCGTNCGCPSTTTTTTTGTSQAIFSKPGMTTSAPTPANVISTNATNAANPGNKITKEDIPVGLITGVVIGAIFVTATIVIGVIIWRRRRDASGLRETMHHQTDTPKEFSKALTLDQKSRNNMDGTSHTRLSSTGNSDLEGEAFPMPNKTNHQRNAIPAHIAKNGTNSTILTSSQQYINEKNAPDHDYTNGNLASVHRSNRKKKKNRMAKENVSGHKGKQLKRNTVEDDFGYASPDDPPDQDKGQKLNSTIAFSPQSSGFSKRGSSGEDHGYAGVYDVEIFKEDNGGTGPEYENWIKNTLQSKNLIHDSETKLKTTPSTVLAGNINNSHSISGAGNYGDSNSDQEFSKCSEATSAFCLVKVYGSGNSDYENPCLENDYDRISVNGNTQIDDNSGMANTNMDDDNSTAGNEYHSGRPNSDATCSKTVDAKHHDEKGEMHNPYNNSLNPKEDPGVRKPRGIPTQNKLPADQLAYYSNVLPTLNAFSSRENTETTPVIDVASMKL